MLSANNILPFPGSCSAPSGLPAECNENTDRDRWEIISAGNLSQSDVCIAMSKFPVPTDIPAELVEIWEHITEDQKHDILRVQDTEMRVILLKSYKTHISRQDEDAKKQAEEIHQAIIPSGQPRPEQMRFSFAPFPTQLTRTSPFFPISTQEIGTREYIRDMIIASHSWGTMSYSGPKLSVYEEDYLMIILALLCDVNSRIEETGGGEPTYTFVGTIRQILHLKGIENPGANYYRLVIESMKLMASASFTLTTKKTGGKGKKPEGDTIYVNNIITNIMYKTGSGDIRITVNPFFYQAYGQGLVTWIDVQTRAKLKSPNAKALYRFVMSHRDDHWEGPLLTLAVAINLDPEMPKNKIRVRLRKAIHELVEAEVLLAGSEVYGDVVKLLRTARKGVQKKIT